MIRESDKALLDEFVRWAGYRGSKQDDVDRFLAQRPAAKPGVRAYFDGGQLHVCVAKEAVTKEWHLLAVGVDADERVKELEAQVKALEERIAEYEAPRLNLLNLNWSDREIDVSADDHAAIANVVIGCALDHSYDRGDGVPYGLGTSLRERLLPIVARHLAAKRPDWMGHTVEMNNEERESLRLDILTVLDEKAVP